MPFLFGKDTGTDWNAELQMKGEILKLEIANEKVRSFPSPTVGSHYKIKLHDLNEWKLEKTVHLIEEETSFLSKDEKKEKLVSYNTIKKIHEVTNHKSANDLMWAFKCADLLGADLTKW